MTEPTTPVPGIFVNYRRQDTSHVTGQLYDRLVSRFGAGQVFRDKYSLGPGVKYAREIERVVGGCRVLLPLIGREWLSTVDAAERCRLEAPNYLVRLEIEAALKHDALVVPVLIDGTTMPGPQELPGELAQLAGRNAANTAGALVSWSR